MKWQTILPLIQKDLTLFFRNRFYTFITIVGLAAYAGLYYAMPASVDETMEVGLYLPASSAQAFSILEDDGLSMQMYASPEALAQAVLDKEVGAGFAIPPNFLEEVAADRQPTIEVYLPSDVDPELKAAMPVMVEALSLAITGRDLNIEANEVVLGRDMAGEQIPPRDRMLPLFAVVLLMFETMGLASLLAEEVQSGTIRALLVSPMGTREFFIAKGLLSVFMVLTQALALMLVVGAMGHQPLLLFTTLSLGALLVTGIGFVMGAVGRDMLSVMAWGMLAMLVLILPSAGVVFPGVMTAWAKLIPSYFLVDTVNQVINYGAGWAQVRTNLLVLLAWDAVLLLLGAAVLKRKFA